MSAMARINTPAGPLARRLGRDVLVAAAFMAVIAGSAQVQAQVSEVTAAPTLAALQRQVNDGQFAAAYETAMRMPDQQGDPHFDFLYGVAAVNVGHTAEAVLALERHLAAVPGNDRARLDLARAYFELNDYVRARQEFQFVLRYNPPGDVRANIQRYLESMQTRESLSGRGTARFYLETGLGADDNANIGTYNTTIDTPNVAGTLVDATSRAQASNYSWLAGGAKWVRAVSPPFAVFGGLDFDRKYNQDLPQFDVSNVSAYAGFSQISGASLYRLTLADAVMSVNNLRYRASLSTTGELQYAVGNGLTLNGSLQYAEQSFNADISYRDSTMETLALGVQQAYSGTWRPTLGLLVSASKEDNLNRRADLSQLLNTWRASISVSPMDRLGISLAYGEQLANYQATDIALGNVRVDQLSTTDLVLNYALDRNWVLRADVQASENRSTQSLYAYRRTLGGIKLRYSF